MDYTYSPEISTPISPKALPPSLCNERRRYSGATISIPPKSPKPFPRKPYPLPAARGTKGATERLSPFLRNLQNRSPEPFIIVSPKRFSPTLRKGHDDCGEATISISLKPPQRFPRKHYPTPSARGATTAAERLSPFPRTIHNRFSETIIPYPPQGV